jgi:NADH-quinone oxidoreductase subunit K
MISLTAYAFVSMMLFSIGAIGVIARRNIFVIYMSIEMMLNGINLFLVTFARYHFNMDPQIITIMVISIAAAEAAIFLSVIILLYKEKNHEYFTISMDYFSSFIGCNYEWFIIFLPYQKRKSI